MRAHEVMFAAALPVFGGCSLGGTMPAEYPAVSHDASLPPPTSPTAAAPTVAQDEATVVKEARLDAITRIALAKNPAVLEARASTRAALARVKAAGRLPDLELKYELWGQPLNRPWALGDAQMHMFGFRQVFPAAGALDAYSRVAMQEAKGALELQRARELDVVSDVRKVWSLYWAADRERAIHVEHGDVTKQLLEIARVQLVVGKASQGDLLRFELEGSKIHGDIIVLEQQKITSRARLNALMGRAPDAALGAPPEPKLVDAAPRIDELRAFVLAKRPELLAAKAAVKKSEAAADAAKSEARFPMVMVGLDYQLMPMGAMPHNFGGMVQLSLPWLNPRRAEEVKAAEAAVEAEKAAARALEIAVLLQLQETIARYEAQRATLTLIDTKLLPQAKKTFDALQAGYSAGGGDALSVVDALRTYLSIRIDRSRAAAQVEIAIADVERAVGAPLSAAKPSAMKGGEP